MPESPNPVPRLPPILRSLAKALAIGAILGLILRAAGQVTPLSLSVAVCTLFSVPMALGFHLAHPWVEGRPEPGRSALRQASGKMLRTLLLYTLLLAVAVLLVRVALGLDLASRPAMAMLTFTIGLAATAVVSGLHNAENLVLEERARGAAELETLRLRLLEADHARKTEELEEARRLQLSMLPRQLPERPGFAFAHWQETATEVGGDTYDHRTLAGGGLLLAFGDATGHGLQAGLMVTAVKAIFHTLPAVALPEAMAILNHGIRSLGMARMGMALTLLRLEGDNLCFCSAGMPPLCHLRADGSLESHRTSGPPLGQLRQFPYLESELILAPGDSVLLCSDGLAECMDPADRMLGYDRVGPLFLAHGQEAPEALLASLAQEAKAWAKGRPLVDDLSLLVVRNTIESRSRLNGGDQEPGGPMERK